MKTLVCLLLFHLPAAAGFSGCAAPDAGARTAPPKKGEKADPADALAKLVEAHNDERKKDDLPPLKVNDMLKAAAQRHADDMAKHRKMDHKGSDDSTPFDRMEKAGYKFKAAAENIAEGYRTLDDLMKGWMTSEGHKKNILGKYKDIGAAYATDEDGTPYWCVTFGTPLDE